MGKWSALNFFRAGCYHPAQLGASCFCDVPLGSPLSGAAIFGKRGGHEPKKTATGCDRQILYDSLPRRQRTSSLVQAVNSLHGFRRGGPSFRPRAELKKVPRWTRALLGSRFVILTRKTYPFKAVGPLDSMIGTL